MRKLSRWYKLVEDLLTIEDFQLKIKEYKNSFDDLLDEEVLALLVVDELGRNTHSILRIEDLHPSITGTLIGRILSIIDDDRKTVLETLDDTGVIPVIVWKRDREEELEYQFKEVYRFINGYVKQDGNQLEFHLGKWSSVEKIDVKTLQPINIKGFLREVKPTHVYLNESGEYDFVTTIKIQTSNGINRVIVWGEQVKNMQKHKPGDYISMENISVYQHRYGRELHVTDETTIS